MVMENTKPIRDALFAQIPWLQKHYEECEEHLTVMRLGEGESMSRKIIYLNVGAIHAKEILDYKILRQRYCSCPAGCLTGLRFLLDESGNLLVRVGFDTFTGARVPDEWSVGQALYRAGRVREVSFLLSFAQTFEGRHSDYEGHSFELFRLVDRKSLEIHLDEWLKTYVSPEQKRKLGDELRQKRKQDEIAAAIMGTSAELKLAGIK